MEGFREERRKWIALGVFALIAAGVVAAILIGRSGGGDDSTTATSSSGCEQVEPPKPKTVSFKAPKQVLAKGETATAVVETSCGTFEIGLDATRAPRTANSFAFLADEGFYDDLSFPRVAPEFVIQGGSPFNNTTGGPGYTVDEKPPANLAYTEGVVAMAKTAAEPPGRSGSQFFVVLSADAGLPPEYALVGKVEKGIDVVERIGKLGNPEDEKPKQTVLIEKIRVEQR
jgi:cyclophilin family peptidyl-prolyl cis-trans isomerase